MTLPTDLASYDEILPKLPTKQARILALIRQRPAGMAAYQVNASIGGSCRRLSALVDMGLLEYRHEDGERCTDKPCKLHVERRGPSKKPNTVYYEARRIEPVEKAKCPCCGTLVSVERITGQLGLR